MTPNETLVGLLKALSLVATAAFALYGLRIESRKAGKLTSEGWVVALGIIFTLALSITLQERSQRLEVQRAEKQAADYRRLLDTAANRYTTVGATLQILVILDGAVLAKEGYSNRLSRALAAGKIGCKSTTLPENPGGGTYDCGDHFYDNWDAEEISFDASSSLMPSAAETNTAALLLGTGYGLSFYKLPYGTRREPLGSLSFTVGNHLHETSFTYNGTKLTINIKGDAYQGLQSAGISSLLDLAETFVLAGPSFNYGPCRERGVRTCDQIWQYATTSTRLQTLALRFPHHKDLQISEPSDSTYPVTKHVGANGAASYEMQLPKEVEKFVVVKQ
jgi:hypothetical protein